MTVFVDVQSTIGLLGYETLPFAPAVQREYPMTLARLVSMSAGSD